MGWLVELFAGEASVGDAGTEEVVIVKFAFDISKKILPTASTRIRACVVAMLGTVIFSVPSLGVLARIVVG